MWSKNKEKEQRTVTKTVKETHYVTQTSQTLSVKTTHATSRPISSGFPSGSKAEALYSSSVSRGGNNAILPFSSSASNLATKTNLDAKPFNQPTINLNYQSPYRNSPVYSSFQHRPRAATTISTTIPYRAALPGTVKLLPSVEPKNEKIIVKKTGRVYDNLQIIPTYETHSKNRGEVLIINNIMFKDKGYRHGAEVDDKNLQNLFKQMGFKVDIERNQKKSGMINKVKAFSKRSSLKSADIAIVIIMSHGTKNTTIGGTEIFALDEKGVHVDDLIEFFNETDCKQMANKPKIFIFQCCRGDNEQFIENDAVAKKSALINALIAYSTLPGFVSHRDPISGTWYIRTLCDVFSQHAHEYHVEDLLKMVDVKLGAITKDVRQTTNYENRGFKRCFLHPV